jgi:hypothetical protein
VPLQRAISFVATPSASSKEPPAYSAGPLPPSNTARAASEEKVTPPPSPDQLAPSHFATRFAAATPRS